MELTDYRRVLHGISGVHATAYDASGEIDAATTAGIVSTIAASGVHNIVTGGNTGEFYSLTLDEILRLQEIAVEATAGRAAVTAAAGRSLRDAIHLGRAAGQAGCDGVMIHHPLDPFAAPQEQVNYFIGVAEAIDIPVVAYVRSDAIPVDEMVRLATHPRILGVKFATPNTMFFADCVRATQGSSATWICGLAETWALPFYALGGKGFTSGLVNVAPARSLAVWNALEAGDYPRARAVIDSIAAFEAMRTLYRNGANVTVVKEALQIAGLDVGAARLPNLTRLSPEHRAQLETIISTWATDGLV